MKKYMKEYLSSIDDMLKKEKIKDIDKVIEEHLIKINFFMHERLIHFLVTMLFALMSLIVFLYTLKHITLGMILLNFLLLVLLVPYIFHYYYLENSVQHMYKQYDELKKIKNL